ncbi:hypothetical protein [Sphingomonas sp.]|uniref:hypothetical protein n=1 Tax=Sphingomonas sp. TaxID=28214 RepID=UPI001ECA44EA|nr:hypothetical protein [Sphingomonas sp.]MBX3594454.1 hypothetical protein [Sphingomonas sp.]
MEVAIVIGLVVAAVFVLPNLLADDKTKLFRRVWSSERARPTDAIVDAQHVAVKKLLAMYGVRDGDDPHALRKSVASLMADALIFDRKHPRNGGVEVTAVLARHIRIRFPNIGADK